MLQRTLPAGFIAPCFPTKTDKLPSGDLWLHEIKHDGFQIIAQKDGPRVRLYSRPGNDLTRRFPLIVDAMAQAIAGGLVDLPEGSLSVLVGRHGAMNPAGRVRCNMRNQIRLANHNCNFSGSKPAFLLGSSQS